MIRTWCSEEGLLWKGQRQSADRRLLLAVLGSMSASSGPRKGTPRSGGCGGSSVLFPSRKAEGETGYLFFLATCPQGSCPGELWARMPGHAYPVYTPVMVTLTGRARLRGACRSCSEIPNVARDLTIA